MPIKAVCFDVGETLIDETRHWDGWAEFLGVPRLTLFTALGVTMSRGQSLRRVFEIRVSPTSKQTALMGMLLSG